MPVEWTWTGLSEFRAALKKLPEDLHDDARVLITLRSDAAFQRVYDRYPTGEDHSAQPTLKGNAKSLRDGLVKRVTASRFGTDIAVRSTAPHAHLFEYGTAARKTARGWGRGRMPPAKIFRPETRAEQVSLLHELVDMVRSHGLTINISEVL